MMCYYNSWDETAIKKKKMLFEIRIFKILKTGLVSHLNKLEWLNHVKIIEIHHGDAIPSEE